MTIRFFTALSLTCACFLWLGTFGPLLPHCLAQSPTEIQFKLESGTRSDDFDWNIAGTLEGTSPNILSELQWRELETFMVRAQSKVTLPLGQGPFPLTVRGSVGYGWIYDGSNRDSDYLGDNRTLEFSRSDNTAGDGDTLEADLALGPRVSTASGKLALTPLIGYAYRKQELTMTDGFQTIPDLGPFPGLDSTYEHFWQGPFVGLDFEWKPLQKFSISSTLEYHRPDYEAEADWNLRPDFNHPKSFEHKADGKGVLGSLSAHYYLSPAWSVNLGLNYQKWKADNGTDEVFFSDGTTGITRLNEVNWRSTSVLLGLTWQIR